MHNPPVAVVLQDCHTFLPEAVPHIEDIQVAVLLLQDSAAASVLLWLPVVQESYSEEPVAFQPVAFFVLSFPVQPLS